MICVRQSPPQHPSLFQAADAGLILFTMSPAPVTDRPEVLNSFPPETLGALRAMNRAFARVVIENHRLGLPVIQCLNGEMVEIPAESLLPLAQSFLETNGEPLPGEVGAQELVTTRLSFCGSG